MYSFSKMDFSIFFSCILLFTSIIASSSSSSCEIKNQVSGCRYEVKCSIHSGSVNNPNCNREPNVTFTLVNVNENYLTTGFFSATNFDSRVRDIKVVNSTFSTIDSTAFKYYTKTVAIDISNNNVVTINAEAFRPLQNLILVNLSYNSIESFYPKSFLIVSDIKFTLLQTLDISNNKLKYIGEELNNVPNLKRLYLQNNQLSSISDDAFKNLIDLRQLYLQHNLITSVNLSFINLKSLEDLDISYNHLTKLSGYEINRLVAIVNFNISHNEVTTVESNCFELATHLMKADFSYNYIKITIKKDMFINSKQLNYLDFYSNKIFGLEENVFKQSNLSYLNLEENNVTGDINVRTLSNLRNLSRFDLSQQSVLSIRNYAFAEMDSLLNLNLSHNLIGLIEDLSFINTSITVLDLSYNNISNLNFLKNCLVNLTALYINNNNITIVPKYTFFDQLQLKRLDLSENNIIRIEEHSLPLNNLQYLNVVGNTINSAIKPNIFSPGRFLRFLDLSFFNISKINNLAFDGLPVLAKLNLSHNCIENIEDDSFREVGNLYSLDISYNKLEEIKLNSSKLPNLRALHIQNNKLTNISRLISNQSKLTYLDLSNNNIVDVTALGTHILPDITVLYLHNNNIKHFNNMNTNSLKSLIDLGLSSNGFNEINLSYFKDLMSIDLSNNNLMYINSSFLKENVYLQSLDISRNKISDVPPGTFQFMKNLKLVNLSSNCLSKLRYGSLRGLHKTEILDLSRNKITYLDVDVFHECEELKTLIIDYNRIKTFDVERLILIAVKKLRTLSLGGNPILCREIVNNIKSANVTFYAIRFVEVTSIDKIYHEDNVHGIKCGDDPPPLQNNTVQVNSGKQDIEKYKDSSSIVIVIIWCSAITVFLIAGGIILYKKRIPVFYRNNASQSLRESVYQSDLLG